MNDNRISTAEEAAASIRDGMTVAMSGYAMAGYPKAVVEALVQRKQSGEALSFEFPETEHRGRAIAEREGATRAKGIVELRRHHRVIVRGGGTVFRPVGAINIYRAGRLGVSCGTDQTTGPSAS